MATHFLFKPPVPFKHLFFVSAFLFLIITLFIFYLQLQQSKQQFNQTLNQQALAHVSMLAHGSIDDLLSKDYGDLESWVRSAAETSFYAYVFIASPDGVILLHSDLGRAGKKVTTPGKRAEMVRSLIYSGNAVKELHMPIMIERSLIGYAHIAYYEKNIQDLLDEQLLDYGLLYFIHYALSILVLFFVLYRAYPASNSTP